MSLNVTALSTAIRAAIKTALDAEHEGEYSGPYRRVVPAGKPFPRVIYDLENIENLLSTPIQARDALLVVRTISARDHEEADIFNVIIEEALDGATLTVEGQRNYNIAVLGSTPDLEEARSGGGYYYNTGKRFRIQLEEAEDDA